MLTSEVQVIHNSLLGDEYEDVSSFLSGAHSRTVIIAHIYFGRVPTQLYPQTKQQEKSARQFLLLLTYLTYTRTLRFVSYLGFAQIVCSLFFLFLFVMGGCIRTA